VLIALVVVILAALWAAYEMWRFMGARVLPPLPPLQHWARTDWHPVNGG
jgi:hypothetical protein